MSRSSDDARGANARLTSFRSRVRAGILLQQEEALARELGLVDSRLTNQCAGITLIAHIGFSQVSNMTSGDVLEAMSTAAADTGNTFRYDPAGGQYIYNLATKGAAVGTWYIYVDLGDGTLRKTAVSLKK